MRSEPRITFPDEFDVSTELPKIQEYAAIGDGRAAALVSSRGSIDWLCWPQFDSPSLFAGIIGGPAGGCWSVAPARVATVAREYVDDTNVLRTRFRAPGATPFSRIFSPWRTKRRSAARSIQSTRSSESPNA
jgi:GH15 family glucan-1,4-alpha-glucosidase